VKAERGGWDWQAGLQYGRETLAVGQRILIELIRRQRSLMAWAIFPIAILLLNGCIMANSPSQTLAKAFQQVAPSTLVGVALFFSCMGGTIATVIAEREQQTFKRLFMSPLTGLAYFSGIFMAYGCIGIGQGVLVYLVAACFGADFPSTPGLGLIILILSIAAYVGVGFTVAAHLGRRTEDVNALVSTFGVPLLMLGGAFFPTSLLPNALLKVAKFNPIYHMIKAMVGVAAQGESFSQVQDHVLFLGGFALLSLGVGWWSYCCMLRSERSHCG
jgi:ABC-2 type transport system permease protein